VIRLKKIGELNVSDRMQIKLINREIYQYRKKCIEKLKIDDPEAYEKMIKARRKYFKDWRARNPDYNRKWLRAYYKKYPEKFREYQRRYWRKRALSRNQD